MTHPLKMAASALLAFILLAAMLVPASAENCLPDESCAQPAANGRQRFPSELDPFFDGAGLNRLGAGIPVLPKILSGYPNAVYVDPYVPCILLKAVGYTESSGWRQYRAEYGEYGDTVISGDGGYGIMQITSGMTSCIPPGNFDRELVARSSQYNIGTGALFLINKWNKAPYIGDNDPRKVENWYYATWAYNGWSIINNPNYECPLDDPECGTGANNPYRTPFNGTQKRWWYPYQELVWGFAANPPLMRGLPPAWSAVPLTLPDKEWFPPDAMPAGTSWLPQPLPTHGSCSVIFLPMISNTQ